MKQWLWVLYIEEYKGNRSLINAGLVAADDATAAREKAQDQIGFNLIPGMAINITDDIMGMTVTQLMNKKGE